MHDFTRIASASKGLTPSSILSAGILLLMLLEVVWFFTSSSITRQFCYGCLCSCRRISLICFLTDIDTFCIALRIKESFELISLSCLLHKLMLLTILDILLVSA